MSLSVSERAHRIATFRFLEVRLMEIVAAWTPTTPEMEAKVMFGRHIWDFAQHADALGKRTFELRQPAQHSLAPSEGYVQLLEDVLDLEGAAERLASLYDAMLPGLTRRYMAYLEEADPVLDAPSFFIIEGILRDTARQRAEADTLRRELGLGCLPPEGIRSREDSLELLSVAKA